MFVWIAVGLLLVRAVAAAVLAALVAPAIGPIYTAGGWGRLLIGGAYVAVQWSSVSWPSLAPQYRSK